MDLRFDGELVRGGREARERFYDTRGYGWPVDGAVAFDPVEAAHLLYRGDVADIDGRDFQGFLRSKAVPETDFLVYKDLRDRGFYLSTASDPGVEERSDVDFVVYPRGKGPWDETVAYRIGVKSEREEFSISSAGVLAIVDEESEITYFEMDRPDLEGDSSIDLPRGVPGELLSDRVVLWEPPASLYEQGFYGQRLGEDRDVLQLSLLEAAYLARREAIDLESEVTEIVERGRSVEGARFDRRLSVYVALRERGVVPKTGFKFGADFRTYAHVERVDQLGHSEYLVRVLPADHTFEPRDLALDVRLAHGVRKQMVFALAGPETIEWVQAGRLTP